MQVDYYLESHITIEPVFDDSLDLVRITAKQYGFKIADLLMKKRSSDTEERSAHDTFMTSHSKDMNDIVERTRACVTELNELGFIIWRYKIENIVLDSRHENSLDLPLQPFTKSCHAQP